MDIRGQFESSLDTLKPRKADAILVLRNWDKDENAERVTLGTELLVQSWSKVMLLLLEDNTGAEAKAVCEMMEEFDWQSVLLVTHRYHMYRAYLTFVKHLQQFNIRIYMQAVPSGIELGERQKIEQYSKLGQCASYEEGVKYLEWLNQGIQSM